MVTQVLYIDPDLQSRMRFRQVGSSLGKNFGSVSLASTLLEGITRFDQQHTQSIVVYISGRFAGSVLKSFIERAQAKRRLGSRLAFLVVASSHSCDLADVADYTLAGVDGVLLEPYSADQLLESTSSALRKSALASSTTRNKIALNILIEGACSALKVSCRRHRAGQSIQSSLKPLRKSVTSLHELSSDLQKDFIASLVERLIRRDENSALPLMKSAPRRVVVREYRR